MVYNGYMAYKKVENRTDEADMRSIADTKKREVVSKATNVTVLLSDQEKKAGLEAKAFSALERRLSPKTVCCGRCKGNGELKNGDGCPVCEGVGHVVEDADMRAIELVLKPKFPTTNVNVNADLEGVDAEDILRMIDSM